MERKYKRLTIKEWNEKRKRELDDEHSEDFNRFPKRTKLICSKCLGDVHDEAHIDRSEFYNRRQVVCTKCGYVDYRII